MKNLGRLPLLLLLMTSFANASPIQLSAGDSVTINGTTVTCEGGNSTSSSCSGSEVDAGVALVQDCVVNSHGAPATCIRNTLSGLSVTRCAAFRVNCRPACEESDILRRANRCPSLCAGRT